MSTRPFQRAPLGQPFTLNPASQQAVGLVAWWPTVNYRGIGPLYDYVGGLHAARTGTTNLVVPDREIGQALTINSTNYWTVTDSAVLDFTGNITLSYWWYTGAFASGTEYGVMGKGGNYPNSIVQWYASKPAFTSVLDFRIGDGSDTFYAAETETTTGINLLTDTLYHMALRRNGTVLETFTSGWKNREQTWDFSAGAMYTGTDDLYLGRAAVATGIGRVADFRIYNRALSDAECIALWAPQTRWDLYLPVRHRRHYHVDTGAVLEQEGYRWRNDDGSESTATWAANQDTALTGPIGAKRLRALVNATGDPASTQYQLEWRLQNGTWRKIR